MSTSCTRRIPVGIPWGLCLVYVLFQLAPRFDMISHVHEHGDAHHHHGYLSAHDVTLEHAALAALAASPAFSGGTPHGQTATNAKAARTAEPTSLIPLKAGDSGVAPRNGLAHTHYQEDPNLLGLNDFLVPSHAAYATLAPREHPATRPAAAAALPALARAPPRTSIFRIAA